MLRFFFFCCLLSVRLSAQDITLGVLEEQKGNYFGEPNYRAIRIVFRQTKEGWQSFPNCQEIDCVKTIAAAYPQQVNWNVGYKGKMIGAVRGITPTDFTFYASVGLQQIPQDRVPTVGRRSIEFGGSSEAEVYRPLIASSARKFEDPEAWFAATPQKDIKEIFFEAFRKQYPVVRNCSRKHPDGAAWSFRASQLKLVEAYRSNQGWWLGRVRLHGYECDGPLDEAFEDQWFAKTPQGSVFVGRGMWLVEIGDFDGNGHSEMIFSIARANRGGYVLSFSGFTKTAVFEYSYH